MPSRCLPGLLGGLDSFGIQVLGSGALEKAIKQQKNITKFEFWASSLRLALNNDRTQRPEAGSKVMISCISPTPAGMRCAKGICSLDADTGFRLFEACLLCGVAQNSMLNVNRRNHRRSPKCGEAELLQAGATRC